MNKKPKIVKRDGDSFLIDFGGGMKLWFDTWKTDEGDITGDWNKYIFYTDDEQDMKEKAFQEYSNDEGDAVNFMAALELCEQASKN